MSQIAAIVTTEREKVAGGAPIFVADSWQEAQEIAFKLEKILDAAAHDLKTGTLVIVKHAHGS